MHVCARSIKAMTAVIWEIIDPFQSCKVLESFITIWKSILVCLNSSLVSALSTRLSHCPVFASFWLPNNVNFPDHCWHSNKKITEISSRSVIFIPFFSLQILAAVSSDKKMNDSNTVYNSKCPYMFNVFCTVAASLLNVMGFVGNIMIIMSFYKTRTLRTSANFYIVNMATSDLILSFLVGPWIILECFTGFTIFNRFSTESKTGDVLCQSLFFVALSSYTVSVLSSLLIAKDQFIASVHPLKMSLISTKIRTILLLMTWILALGFNLPYYFFSSIVREDGRELCSQKENTFMFIYSMVDFTFGYCMPLSLISALYYKIINSLRTLGPGDSMRRHNQNRNVIKIVMSMVAASFVCWTPYWVLKFIKIAKADFFAGRQLSHTENINKLVSTAQHCYQPRDFVFVFNKLSLCVTYYVHELFVTSM